MARPRMSIDGLTRETAREAGVTVRETRAIIDALLNVIGNSLLAGEAVNLHGVCTLKTVDRAARRARNPQTGETVTVPAKRALVCKQAAGLYD